MTVLEWDKAGDKVYETGVDRGVLYLNDGTAVPWNGLTSVEDNTSGEIQSYYLDGIKILDHVTPDAFEGKLSAFTYPEEFEEILGVVSPAPGLFLHEQESKSFNLSYRTKVGNDLDEDYGYKIHILYNVKALSDAKRFATIAEQIVPNEFSWSLSGTPPIFILGGIKPTVHVSIDSINTDSERFQHLENTLYGTDVTNPRLPSLPEIRVISGELSGLEIIDNGDGTWSANDPTDIFITMIDADTFQIDHANAEYIDSDTYEISDTPYPIP